MAAPIRGPARRAQGCIQSSCAEHLSEKFFGILTKPGGFVIGRTVDVDADGQFAASADSLYNRCRNVDDGELRGPLMTARVITCILCLSAPERSKGVEIPSPLFLIRRSICSWSSWFRLFIHCLQDASNSPSSAPFLSAVKVISGRYLPEISFQTSCCRDLPIPGSAACRCRIGGLLKNRPIRH